MMWDWTPSTPFAARRRSAPSSCCSATRRACRRPEPWQGRAWCPTCSSFSHPVVLARPSLIMGQLAPASSRVLRLNQPTPSSPSATSALRTRPCGHEQGVGWSTHAKGLRSRPQPVHTVRRGAEDAEGLRRLLKTLSSKELHFGWPAGSVALAASLSLHAFLPHRKKIHNLPKVKADVHIHKLQ